MSLFLTVKFISKLFVLHIYIYFDMILIRFNNTKCVNDIRWYCRITCLFFSPSCHLRSSLHTYTKKKNKKWKKGFKLNIRIWPFRNPYFLPSNHCKRHEGPKPLPTRTEKHRFCRLPKKSKWATTFPCTLPPILVKK